MKPIVERALKHGGITSGVVLLVMVAIYYFHHYNLGRVPLVLIFSFYCGCYCSLIYQLAKMFKF